MIPASPAELKKATVQNLPVNHSPEAGPSNKAEQRLMTNTTLPADPSPVAGPSRQPHSKNTIVIREGKTPPNKNGLRRPMNMQLDSATYETICKRRATRPELICHPGPLKLPPPKEGGWTYTTATKQ